GWHFVIRFRGSIHVENAKGETKPAKQWLQPSGRARMMKGVRITNRRCEVPGFVSVKAKDMKEAWLLATRRTDISAAQVIKMYGRRFTIEETFRDLKDPRHGFGMKTSRIRRPDRRDRLIFLFAMAHALLTLLGAASERTGLDRKLRVNTVKKRTHSLFRQGAYWYSAIPAMPHERLQMLMGAFAEIIAEHAVFRETFGFI
ncbi:MAG: transposase, partial [Myxococcales bacterium]|nr:transposase [Myxococcales bacterium]